MKKKVKVFYDLDGVLVDWESKALELLGVQRRSIDSKLKSGISLETMYPEVYDVISQSKEQFWEGLELYPWAEDLINIGKKYGEVAILSSGGNLYRRDKDVASANAGKTRYVSRKFNDIPLILTREKYLCADENSILIDDTREKLDLFNEYGGHTFHFPHAQRIIDNEIPLNTLKEDLERKIQHLV